MGTIHRQRAALRSYNNFKFRVNGTEVFGLHQQLWCAEAHNRGSEHRAAADQAAAVKSNRPPELSSRSITLERGVTPRQEFRAVGEQGLTTVRLGLEVSLSDFRKDIIIGFTTKLANSLLPISLSLLVSEFSGLPDFDPMRNAIAIQHLKLENEGWDGREFPEPARTTFTTRVIR